MTAIDVENTNLKQLANRLVEDIRRRGLRPGDRYLTASVASQQFDASEISIHRAMQLLADRDYLVRQRGSGTFVGSKIEPEQDQSCPLRVVHVVMSMDYRRTATVPAEVLVDRLGVSMPDVVVEVHYVTEHDAMRHLDRIVERIDRQDKRSEGIILIRSSRQMQMYVEESGLPAVAFGGVYPGVKKLAWLDIDQEAVGQVMAQNIIKSKPRRMALIMRNDWRHGDNLMYQGIMRELGAAGYGMDALSILCVPPHREHIAEELHALLLEDAAIAGIMCRTHLYAQVACEIVRTLSRKRRMQIIAGGGRKPASMPYAYVTPEIEEPKQVELVGQMLLDRAIGKEDSFQNRVIAVDFVSD